MDVANPHHHARVSGKPPVRVSLDPRTVRCIAWWSKDYAEWIATWQAESDASPGTLHAFDAHIFNFTLNGAACASVLEPGVRHSFSERLDQLAWLCSAFSPDAVVLRFDPIVHFRRLSEAEVLNNLGDFEAVCSAAGQIGLREVTTAFVCAYPAVQARMQARGLSIVEQSAAEKAAVLERMTATAQSHGLTLRGCCQPPELQLPHGACVSAERVNRLLRAKRMPLLSSAATARDKGQRYPLCHCTQSRDIGGYGADFACPHSCAYCYANPAPAPQLW